MPVFMQLAYIYKNGILFVENFETWLMPIPFLRRNSLSWHAAFILPEIFSFQKIYIDRTILLQKDISLSSHIVQ